MSLERIRTIIVDDHDELGRLVAHRIAEVVRAKAAAGRRAVLGLATGSTPIGVYRELIRLHQEEGLSFANVVTFNLDEYYPMAAPRSAVTSRLASTAPATGGTASTTQRSRTSASS